MRVKPSITFACGNYDRVWGLRDMRVSVEGVDLNMITLEPEECFWRMIRFAEFDAAEMSLSSYSMIRARGDSRFIGIPVFLSRAFQHSSIYVRRDAGIEAPKDLEGRRVGVPEYQMTASVWVRGMLSDDYDVDNQSIVWVTGGLEQAGRIERQSLDLCRPVNVEKIGATATLSRALADGSIDALVTPRMPSVFARRDPAIKRLFPDYCTMEVEYYRRTHMFPILHLVVLRTDTHERYPWLAHSLLKALDTAKRLSQEGVTEAPVLRYTIPLLVDVLERQEELFGENPWSYGIGDNRQVLEVFGRYQVEQGLISKGYDVDGLFAPSTLVESRI